MLKSFSDEKLCEDLQKDPENSEIINELVSRHSGIYFKFIHKYLSSFQNSGIKEDAIADMQYHILRAAMEFDPSKKMKFSSFVGSRARFMCLNILNKQKKEPELLTSDCEEVLKIHSPAESNEPEHGKIIGKFINQLEIYSDKRAKDLFMERYFSQNKVKPWSEIAPKMNLSIQGCINIHNSALKNISKIIRSNR